MLYHTAQNPDKLVKLDGDTLKFEDKGVFSMKDKNSIKMMNALRSKIQGKVKRESDYFTKLAAIDKNKPIVRQLVKDRLK